MAVNRGGICFFQDGVNRALVVDGAFESSAYRYPHQCGTGGVEFFCEVVGVHLSHLVRFDCARLDIENVAELFYRIVRLVGNV